VSGDRRGAALLEVLAAVAVLAFAGVGFLELVGAHTRATGEAVERENEQADEDRLLSAWVLLTREDLELRLGTTRTGPYLVTVHRPETMLFRISIARTSSPEVEDLVTMVYREDIRAQ